MDFYTCPVCNTQVNNSEREQHEMICNNAFREEEFMDMIPCEVCGRLVNYENYSEHLNRCYSFTGISDNVNFTEQLDSAINNLQNIINNNQLNINNTNSNLNENENENMDVDSESDNDIPPLVSDNLNEHGLNVDADNVMNIFMNILNSGISGSANNIIINPEIDDYTELTNLSETIGNVEIGIENPDAYFKKTVNIGFKCPICYNICENTMITSCNHEICADCTKEWYSKNKKCVICMNEIKKL